MTYITFGTCGISRNNLKRRYLTNKRHFLDCFIPFLKCALNLEHSGKRDECSSLVLSKVIDSERGGYLNV